MYSAPLKDINFTFTHLLGGADDAELATAIFGEAAKFAEQIIAPTNHSGDMTGAVWQDGAVITPQGFREAYAAMGAQGWTALEAHEEYGGQNLPMAVSAFVNEMWQSANMAFALCHLLTQGQIYALEKYASPQQKTRFIPPMVAGKWTGTMNLTEAQAGSDLAGIRTMATPRGEYYLLKGQKTYITYGEHDMAENIIHLVLARTPNAPPGHKGISIFLVPKFLINEDGSLGAQNDVACVSIEKKLGIKASPRQCCNMAIMAGRWVIWSGRNIKGLTSCSL